MAEFKTVSGQLEGMWNGAMGEAEARGRSSGEAAATERVLQAAAKLEAEWRESGHPLQGLEQELRRRLSVPEPVAVDDGLERLTFAEWEERHQAANPAPVVVDRPEFFQDVGDDLPVDLDHLPDMRPGFRVGVAGPLAGREGDEERRVLVDRRGGEAPLPELARDFEGERARQLAAEDAAQVFPVPSPLPIREARPEEEAAVQADMVADQARERSTL